jgi:hypothetical protein
MKYPALGDSMAPRGRRDAVFTLREPG